MCDFHLIKDKPAILAIDGLDYYLEQKNLGTITKQMRIEYLLTLLKDCQNYLDESSSKSNNLIVSYRCTHEQESDFARLYYSFCKFSSQVFYLSRSEVSKEIDQALLNPEMAEMAKAYHVEMFHARENDRYLEEEFECRKKVDGMVVMPFKMVQVTGVSPLFELILKELRDYGNQVE